MESQLTFYSTYHTGFCKNCIQFIKISIKIYMFSYKKHTTLEWFLDPERLCVRDLQESLFFPSVRMSVRPQILGNSFFLVNYNCDASYDHLWCPNGPEVNRKWTGSDRKWARSGLEVSICPSVRLSIPNTSLTSLTNLMRGIYKRRALAPCDF